MTRDYADTTSTCRTCTYWETNVPGLQHGQGYCGYQSLPAWVWKHLTARDDHRIMSALEGRECWLHTARSDQNKPMHERLLETVTRPRPDPCLCRGNLSANPECPIHGRYAQL